MSGVNVLAVLDDLIADMGDTPGTTGHQVGQVRDAVAELVEAATALLETQDAVDNRETAGPNAEDYFVLIRRRNAAQHDFADALANVTGGAA